MSQGEHDQADLQAVFEKAADELGEVEVRRRLSHWIFWGSEDRRDAWITQGGDPELYGGVISPPDRARSENLTPRSEIPAAFRR